MTVAIRTRVVWMGGDAHYATEDATLCEEYLDPTVKDENPVFEPDAWEDLASGTAVTCVLCLAEARYRIHESARQFVADELGVSIDEID